MYGAAEAAARLQDMDAIIATQSALEEWQQANAKMHVSPLAPAYREFPPKSDSEAASTPDMQDRYVQRGGGRERVCRTRLFKRPSTAAHRKVPRTCNNEELVRVEVVAEIR